MPAPPSRSVSFPLAVIAFLAGAAPRSAADLPGPRSERAASTVSSEDARAIEAQAVCVGSTVHSVGELGPALLYRGRRRADGKLEVGYYAFFSEERPWGNNWLTWSVLPALVLDLVYTRALFVAPGLQRAAYGPADVEGFRVVYARDGAGGLHAEGAMVDDDRHRPRALAGADLYAADPDRITLATDGWSHHLGARVRTAGELVYRRCYGPDTIRPLADGEARRFHLERRAAPARSGEG